MSRPLPRTAMVPVDGSPGAPSYRPVEAPPCDHTVPVPRTIQDESGMPPTMSCDLPVGHEGSHLKVWNPVEGWATGWAA